MRLLIPHVRYLLLAGLILVACQAGAARPLGILLPSPQEVSIQADPSSEESSRIPAAMDDETVAEQGSPPLDGFSPLKHQSLNVVGRVSAPSWLYRGERQRPVGPEELALSWHGAATLEIRSVSTTVLIDPFYTRDGLRRLLFGGPIQPDPIRIDRHLRRPDAILVNHCHYDHFLDAPYIAGQYGVPLYLPQGGVPVALASGVPAGLVRPIKGGDDLVVGDLAISVVKARHPKVLPQLFLGGAIPATFSLPLRFNDYRTDEALAFLIRWKSRIVAHVDAPDSLEENLNNRPVDLAFVSHAAWWQSPKLFKRVAHSLAPAVFVPMHHDDFFRSLDEPFVENPFARVVVALGVIERDIPGTCVVRLRGFFEELRIRN